MLTQPFNHPHTAAPYIRALTRTNTQTRTCAHQHRRIRTREHAYARCPRAHSRVCACDYVICLKVYGKSQKNCPLICFEYITVEKWEENTMNTNSHLARNEFLDMRKVKEAPKGSGRVFDFCCRFIALAFSRDVKNGRYTMGVLGFRATPNCNSSAFQWLRM